MRRLLIPILLAVGCGTPAVDLLVFDEENNKDFSRLPDEVLDACDMWGLECVSAVGEPAYGRLVISLFHDTGGKVVGRNVALRPCVRAFWAERSVDVLAHEIGHALRLEHDGHQDGDLMFSERGGEHISDDDFDYVQREAHIFAACRP